METLKAIFTRRSIREYTQQAVPDELVQELLAAAMQAPSAGNQQPWHFIIVTERDQLHALADVLPFGKSLQTAPLGIAVCADLKLARYPDYWVQDCSAATQNLLLAAHALGLGVVWLGVFPSKSAWRVSSKYWDYLDKSCRCASSLSATPRPSRAAGQTLRRDQAAPQPLVRPVRNCFHNCTWYEARAGTCRPYLSAGYQRDVKLLSALGDILVMTRRVRR